MADKESRKVLEELKGLVSPEVFSQVASQLGRTGEEVMDNQNQNQGITEELARLKPDVLRELTIGFRPGEDMEDNNQNQNQGKLADMLKLKPDVLRQIRVTLRGGEELMDNQNQNQGTQQGAEESVQTKPPLSEPRAGRTK